MIRNQQNPDASSSTVTMSKENIEAIFPLRSMQTALLWQNSNDRIDPGFLQVRMKLVGPLDQESFDEAWQFVSRRHAALRSSVKVRESADPMIVVWRQVELPVEFTDLTALSPDEQNRKIEFLLEDNYRNGLPLDLPPVNRVDVYLLDSITCTVIWRCHHLFVDGWSSAIVAGEVISAYEAITNHRTPDLPALGCTYRDYLSWLNSVDQQQARQFWSRRLENIKQPVPSIVPVNRSGSSTSDQDGARFIETRLEREESSTIQQVLTQNKLTVNSLCQGCWTLILGRLLRQQQIVFGTTVSGRTAPLDGMQGLVGMFANVIPVCTAINEQNTSLDWLGTLRDEAFESQPFESVTLAEIPSSAIVTRFESLLVVENFPALASAASGSLTISQYSSDISSSYPLTMCVMPGESWVLRLQFDALTISRDSAQQLCECFSRLLLQVCRSPRQPLAELINSETLAAIEGTVEVENPTADSSPGNADWRQPFNATEARLAMIWEETLGRSQQDTRANFFDLGGTSIAAVRMFARIDEVFGHKLSPSLLMQHSTIASLAKLIDSNATGRLDVLVPIRKSGNRAPVICIHVGGGYSFYYRHLARHIDPARPVWSMHPVGLEGGETHSSIDEIVRYFNDRLLQQFPDGGLHLAGYCMGAVVCVEMARQLRSQGVSVKSVTVLDSGPAFIRKQKSLAQFLAQDTLARKIGKAWRYAKYRVRRSASLLATQINDFWRSRFGSAESRRKFFLERVERVSRAAYFRWDQKPVDMPVILVRSREYVGREDKAFHLQWANHTNDLRIEVADVGHETLLLEPEVRKVAAILDSHLVD